MTESVLSTEQQISSLWELGGLSWRELSQRVWGGINQNDLLNRAYELAYNFLLAIFPLLLCLVAVLGLFASEGSKLQHDLFFYFQQALPPPAYHLVVRTLNEITANSGGGKITLGLLLALVSGAGGMTQLMSTLNAAYEVREGRSWIRVHMISLGLTIAMSLLIIAALLLILAGGWAISLVVNELGLSTGFLVTARVLQWTVALTFVVLAFAVIYYFAPDVKEQHWYWITPGSVVGVLVWALASGVLRVSSLLQNV